MRKIISVSRRTDVPTFYGDWFMNRLKEGFAGYVNPFGGQKYIVSLKPEDVICFVFWSKDYGPFIEKLRIIKERDYEFYFNYTITGLPNFFECNLAGTEDAINALKKISSMYSPKHINWRYDPIVISDKTDHGFHIEKFKDIAAKLEGYVERCYFSYAIQYGKVKTNFNKFQKEHNILIDDLDKNAKIDLANQLAEIANSYGISMQTCCGDFLISPNIKKAHCVDGSIIEGLFFEKSVFRYVPTRKECGCTESTDIGAYDTCPHGCIYCYANVNKEKANKAFKNHNPKSAFLGHSKEKSDKWIHDIETSKKNTKIEKKGVHKQLSLFR